ncbi:AGAP013527-PA-like protein [Anopheles sinensis]|uniref:AGAP013527-PA-like protein n=1 Tax=Anopheles sinensis TaxID=74873 RepID=A0A084W0I7_ANOSI|nr:AGAP013527-PA-like protein [Anopheles sinensis]
MEEDDNTVRITHYINPHCFWYKPEASYLPNHHQKQYMQKFNEDCEREFANRKYKGFGYKPNSGLKVGDMVAQRNKEFQRWIRCEVDAVVADLSGDVWLHLWALDEGLPIKSFDEPVQPLPEAYRSHPAHALRGAIRNILPCTTSHDYVQGKNVQSLSQKWLQGAVSVMQTFFDDALSVSLTVHARIKLKKEVVHFVDVSLMMHNNKSYSILNLLTTGCSDQVTVSPDAEFFKGIICDLQSIFRTDVL